MMENEVMVFIEETWSKATNILDTYALPANIHAQVLQVKLDIEALSSEVNGE